MKKKPYSTIKYFTDKKNEKNHDKKKEKEKEKEKKESRINNGKAVNSKKIWHKILSSNKDMLKESWKSKNPKKEYDSKVKELLKKFK